MSFAESLDWYPDRDRDEPDPTHFDEHHVAWIWFLDQDVEVTGYWVYADPSVGAPAAWRIEKALIEGNEALDVTALLYEDDRAMRRAENALDVARAGGWS